MRTQTTPMDRALIRQQQELALEQAIRLLFSSPRVHEIIIFGQTNWDELFDQLRPDLRITLNPVFADWKLYQNCCREYFESRQHDQMSRLRYALSMANINMFFAESLGAVSWEGELFRLSIDLVPLPMEWTDRLNMVRQSFRIPANMPCPDPDLPKMTLTRHDLEAPLFCIA
jgi:hypothetical protein